MSYSLNEFEALALKAARGAGLPWGLAEEAGKAVRILSSFGFTENHDKIYPIDNDEESDDEFMYESLLSNTYRNK